MYRKLLLIFVFYFPSMLAFADDAQLAVWANEAIVATYTYSYEDYLAQQKNIAKYFTSQGWMTYSKALNDSKLPEAVQTNSYYVSSVATLPPVIKSVAENQWQAVMPLLVVYKNPQYQQKQTLQVTITFIPASGGQGVRGYAITSLQSKVIVPTCKCPAEQVEDNSAPAAPAPAPAPTEAPKDNDDST
jgi:hypothetical protein